MADTVHKKETDRGTADCRAARMPGRTTADHPPRIRDHLTSRRCREVGRLTAKVVRAVVTVPGRRHSRRRLRGTIEVGRIRGPSSSLTIRIRRIRIQIAHYSLPGAKHSTESTRALQSHPGTNSHADGEQTPSVSMFMPHSLHSATQAADEAPAQRSEDDERRPRTGIRS